MDVTPSEKPTRCRICAYRLASCLAVCGDYLFGCEEDDKQMRLRRGLDFEEEFGSPPVSTISSSAGGRTPSSRVTTPGTWTISGSSIELTEKTVTSFDSFGSGHGLQSFREIRELFKLFDKNKDNTISGSELGKMLHCMGMEVSQAQVVNIMKELDKNGNGKIEYREFKAFMMEEMKRTEESPQEQENAIRMAFKVFDQNGDGVIDARELKASMKNLGEPLSDKELSDMMREADVDNDGKICYEEFIKIWLASGKK